MSRRTFHHLKQGDVISVEMINYPDGFTANVLTTHTRCVVLGTSPRLLIVDVPGVGGGESREGVVRFSRRSGCEWGASEEYLRICKQHAQRQPRPDSDLDGSDGLG